MAKEKIIHVRIEGVRPLLMHSSRLVDPLDPITKQMKVVSKQKLEKEEKAEKMMRLEFQGGLYFDPEVGPYIPSENLAQLLRQGGTAEKLGKDITRDVEIWSVNGDDMCPLEYEGPRTIEALYDDGSFVSVVSARVGQSRVMRCRPRFRDWAVEFHVHMLPWATMDADALERAMRLAGERHGLGDWRPKHGRFEVTQWQALTKAKAA